jgi:NAD(P)-dependent dehydrogenase (short-subunit alcohol dehydrogenase family)
MKTALIWGAGGGIGQALADQLASENWQILAAGHNLESFSDFTQHIYEVELDNAFAVQSAITAISQEVSEVDLWVYAAGDIISTRVNEMQPADWQRILQANCSPRHPTCFTWVQSANACSCQDYQPMQPLKPGWRLLPKSYARKAAARSQLFVLGQSIPSSGAKCPSNYLPIT